MRVMLWHVHGGWTDAFVRGDHVCLLPTTPERGPWGLGRGGRAWPANAVEIAPEAVAHADVDVVLLQRPEELAVAERLLGRRLGTQVPAVYLEHNTPRGAVPENVHPLADRGDITIVHVSHFNELIWDSGRARTTVIEHGVPDPGEQYTGERARLGVVINEPIRRGRVTGTDLLPRFAEVAPLEVFGMATELLPQALELSPERIAVQGDLPTAALHARLASCRVYLHPHRWTSLGLSLLEAMHLGMPVVALACTEAVRAVPPEAGALSTSVDELLRAARRLIDDPEEARSRGRVARRVARERYGLRPFLERWNAVLDDAVGSHRRTPSRATPRERIHR